MHSETVGIPEQSDGLKSKIIPFRTFIPSLIRKYYLTYSDTKPFQEGPSVELDEHCTFCTTIFRDHHRIIFLEFAQKSKNPKGYDRQRVQKRDGTAPENEINPFIRTVIGKGEADSF